MESLVNNGEMLHSGFLYYVTIDVKFADIAKFTFAEVCILELW